MPGPKSNDSENPPQSRRLAAEALDSLPVAVLLTDKAGRIILENAAATRLLGVVASRTTPLLLKRISRAWTPGPEFLSRLQAGLARPRRSYKDILKLSDGRILEIRGERHPASGPAAGRSWCIRDITDEELERQRLRLVSERLRLALKGTGSGVYDLDLTTGNVYYSDVDRELSMTETVSWIHPEDRQSVEHALRAHLEEGLPFVVEYRTLLSGRYIWLRSRGRALRDNTGRQYRLVGFYNDISEEKAATEALERNEREQRAILAQLGEVVFKTDESGRLLYLNPAWEGVTGRKIENCLCRPLSSFVHPAQRAEIQSFLEGGPTAAGTPTIEGRWLHADGSDLWLDLRVGGLDESGQVIGTLADVTERRLKAAEAQRAHQAADEANRAKSEFLATVSHELRTPFSAIVGASELIRRTGLWQLCFWLQVRPSSPLDKLPPRPGH